MRLLLAEADRAHGGRLGDAARRSGYDVDLACVAEEAWACLERQGAPRIAIWDWALEGLDVCRRLRRREARDAARPYTYLFLLGRRDEGHELGVGLEAGADDLLGRPVAEGHLAARLVVARRQLALRERIGQLERALEAEARRDSLTRALSRGAILELLDRELARSRRTGDPVGIALFEVDGIGRINAERGSAAGDRVLAELAERLRTGVRTSDALGRYGGATFLLVMPGCPESRARIAAERVARLATARPFQSVPGPLTVGFRVGASSACGLRCSGDELYRLASAELADRQICVFGAPA